MKIIIYVIGEDYASGRIQVTVGADQQLRVNLVSAKNLVKGSYTPRDRLEALGPILIEFFHVKQDLLEVTIGLEDAYLTVKCAMMN